ncbi:beta subunit of N-acylethanolamine-hydrolyzing acid amidase-domain-containing protein [Xylariaceae sp. FL0016]|nr:beta subunit of N-acylethanolamine-hydrolyzing acid amidase-domain-containing protein [Xylariaceae sp. FL0016]
MTTPEVARTPIPVYTIDLALPPQERYVAMTADFAPRMRSLTFLFDDLLSQLFESAWLRALLKGLSRVCLRRVYDSKENEELQGISKASGVPMYLLVALNNLLDCLLGCTSGAVPTSPKKSTANGNTTSAAEEVRLMHFRTLDWGMGPLRELLVVLEFVDSSADDPHLVIARSITYAGFVGTLTAVRKKMSISLNFRPNHDYPSKKLRLHQLLVLLGQRRSVGSIMRAFLFKDRKAWHSGNPTSKYSDSDRMDKKFDSDLEKEALILAFKPSAPCYLILCTGQEAAVVEKDYITARVRTSTSFIAQTNHDIRETDDTTPEIGITNDERRDIISSPFDIQDWVEESSDRLQCVQRKWERRKKSYNSMMANKREASMRSHNRQHGDMHLDVQELEGIRPSVSEKTLQKWLREYPTTNECTHFATILDPHSGTIRWVVRKPTEEDDE